MKGAATKASGIRATPFSRAARFRICAWALAALSFAVAPTLRAQDVVVNFDPATTQVAFTLAATLHTVHGTFKLKSGQIHFDAATGKAAGAIVLDANSGNTDNTSRDQKMRAEILESAKFPEITFSPTQITGPVSAVLAGKSAQLQVAGTFRIHGQDHPMTIPVTVTPASASAAATQSQASTKFEVPYVKWGLKNPSTFLLKVSDTVSLEIESKTQISKIH
jgi:polyisoprenoid-binding protein YceI